MFDESNDKLIEANRDLLLLSEQQGFVSFDNIIEKADALDLSLDAIERISGFLLNNGVLIQEKPNQNLEDVEDRSRVNYDAIYDEILTISPSLSFLIDYARIIVPAQRGEINQYIRQAKQGNIYAQKRIFDIFFRVVLKDSLYFYKKYQLDIDETIDYASMGLLKAIEMYDPYKMGNFSTYAPFWIKQYIFRHCHFFNKSVFYPAHVREKIMIINDYKIKHYCSKCPQDPEQICDSLVSDLALRLQISKNVVRNLHQMTLPFVSFESLDDNIISKLYYDDTYLEEELCNSDLSRIVNIMLGALKPQYADVIERRFGLNGKPIMTLDEIGKLYGLTRERVRQIEGKGLKKLREFVMKNLQLFN